MGGGGLISFTGLDLDSVVVKTQNLFSLLGGFLIYTMYHHWDTIKSTNIL